MPLNLYNLDYPYDFKPHHIQLKAHPYDKLSRRVAGGLKGVRLTHMPNPINKALRALGRAVVELWGRMMNRKDENLGLKAGGAIGTSLKSFDYASAKYHPALDKYYDKNGVTVSKDDYTDNMAVKAAINVMPPYNAQTAQNAGHGFGMAGMQNAYAQASMQSAARAHAAMASQQQHPQAVNQYGGLVSTNNWGHVATMDARDVVSVVIEGSNVTVSFITGDELGDPRSYHQRVVMPVSAFRQMIKMFTVESMREDDD